MHFIEQMQAIAETARDTMKKSTVHGSTATVGTSPSQFLNLWIRDHHGSGDKKMMIPHTLAV